MNIYDKSYKKWRVCTTFAVLMILLEFCQARPRMEIDYSNSMEETFLNEFTDYDNEGNMNMVPDEIHPIFEKHPRAYPMEYPIDQRIPVLMDDDKFISMKTNGRKRSNSGRKHNNRIQLCHFKICNMGRKRSAPHYFEQIPSYNRKKK